MNPQEAMQVFTFGPDCPAIETRQDKKEELTELQQRYYQSAKHYMDKGYKYPEAVNKTAKKMRKSKTAVYSGFAAMRKKGWKL